MSKPDNELVSVEVVLNISHDGVRYYPGELVKVTRAEAELFSLHGWAKDPSGAIPYMEPDIRPRKLKVDKSASKQTAPKVGG